MSLIIIQKLIEGVLLAVGVVLYNTPSKQKTNLEAENDK